MGCRQAQVRGCIGMLVVKLGNGGEEGKWVFSGERTRGQMGREHLD